MLRGDEGEKRLVLKELEPSARKIFQRKALGAKVKRYERSHRASTDEIQSRVKCRERVLNRNLLRDEADSSKTSIGEKSPRFKGPKFNCKR